MKDIVKVSVSGISFVFEEEAYLAMKEYLDKLKAGYVRNPDGREIIADIEARAAELILSEQESEQVVGLALIENIIAQLGFPDDMEEPGEEIPVEPMPRRLYRNPEGAIFGGVCSGIGTYFGVDPVWIRLGIFTPLLLLIIGIPFRFSGWSGFMWSVFWVFVLLYIILWIAIPMARNPRQKLEMRGEKITASSIKQNFEEDANTISSTQKERNRRSASVWGDFFYGLGKVLLVFLKVIVVIIAVCFGIAALSVLAVALGLLFSADIVVGWTGWELLHNLQGISPEGYTALILLLVFIPMVVVGYLIFRMLFGSKTNKPFLTIMGVIWLIILLFTTIITFRNADNIRDAVRGIEEGRYEWHGPLQHDPDDWDEQKWQEEWRNAPYGDRDAEIIEKEMIEKKVIEKRWRADTLSQADTKDTRRTGKNRPMRLVVNGREIINAVVSASSTN